MLHEHVVILTVTHRARAARAPRNDDQRSKRSATASYNVRLQYGFMQDPTFPKRCCRRAQRARSWTPSDVTYFLGRETILVTAARAWRMWREKLFVLMARNAVRATAFFRLPPERVVELGVQVEI